MLLKREIDVKMKFEREKQLVLVKKKTFFLKRGEFELQKKVKEDKEKK